MKEQSKIIPIKNKSTSLLVTLIFSFLSIIAMLVVVHFVSISLSVGKIREEIVKYNLLNLSDTVNRYEKHFDLIHQTMLPFMISDQVQNFRQDPQYIQFPAIQQEIHKIIANPQMHTYDIVLYEGKRQQTLDKNASTTAEWKYNVFMASDEYPITFWQEQLTETFLYKVFPASLFTDYSFKSTPAQIGEFLPVVYRSHKQSPFLMMALLDAREMFKEFHVSINDNLLILDKDTLLFSRGNVSSFDDVAGVTSQWISNSHKPESGSGLLQTDAQAVHQVPSYVEHKGLYYFFVQGTLTGFTYVNAIPVEDIAAQTGLKLTLLILLVISMIVGGVSAFLFIKRINNPLKHVIESIQSMNINGPANRSIKEFDAIWEQFRLLHMSKRQIREELDKQTTERQRFSYINQLKQIREPVDRSLTFTDKPFILLLIDLRFKRYHDHKSETEIKWYAYVKEFVDLSISMAFTEAFTLQMEKNQLLSFVFTDSSEQLVAVLEKMKVTLDLDKVHGVSTMAVSSPYCHSDELTTAYEEVAQRMEQRMLRDETQIITKTNGETNLVNYSAEQEWQLDLLLREGHAEMAMGRIRLMLREWNEQGVPAVEILEFCESVVNKVNRLLLESLSVKERNSVEGNSDPLRNCYTISELEQFLEHFLYKFSERIQEQKERQQEDPITSFVTNYLEQHYDTEIYLESMAQKLGISSGYLSGYFKEKTGENFIDYLNSVRISKARELLAQTDWMIRDIAYKVGYQNMNSFNRMFKKYTGLTPSEYRKRQTGLYERENE